MGINKDPTLELDNNPVFAASLFVTSRNSDVGVILRDGKSRTEPRNLWLRSTRFPLVSTFSGTNSFNSKRCKPA